VQRHAVDFANISRSALDCWRVSRSSQVTSQALTYLHRNFESTLCRLCTEFVVSSPAGFKAASRC